MDMICNACGEIQHVDDSVKERVDAGTFAPRCTDTDCGGELRFPTAMDAAYAPQDEHQFVDGLMLLFDHAGIAAKALVAATAEQKTKKAEYDTRTNALMDYVKRYRTGPAAGTPAPTPLFDGPDA